MTTTKYVRCPKCKAENFASANQCRECKAEIPKAVGVKAAISAAILALLIYSVMNTSPEPKSAQEIAADAAFTHVVTVMRAVTKMAREPESIVFESVRSSPDARTICMEYRGRNGFGGMTRENVVVVDSELIKDKSAWGLNCFRATVDQTHARTLM